MCCIGSIDYILERYRIKVKDISFLGINFRNMDISFVFRLWIKRYFKFYWYLVFIK